MPNRPQADDLFARAYELSGESRETFLAEACGGDAELHLKVQGLLAAALKADSFFGDTEGVTINTGEFGEAPEREGHQIGRFRLLRQIGEGGFGVVYLAEQIVPVKRMVALKVIKPGMDSKDVIARFEAERQALALMDHPNIAKVHDAGTTENGRPYFVMELVNGVPLTDYCKDEDLNTEARLALFIDVCAAVQHAHQKGIIHRDLKPSNILVSPHDGKPVVKVIDFGIAKAIAMELTEKTIFTQFGRMIGTPQYMSPEQAEYHALDVDTRSDIYSLGVVLYELLTGTTPLDGGQVRSAPYGELQRLIREETPPKPSTKLAESLSRAGKYTGPVAFFYPVAAGKGLRSIRTLDFGARGEKVTFTSVAYPLDASGKQTGEVKKSEIELIGEWDGSVFRSTEQRVIATDFATWSPEDVCLSYSSRTNQIDWISTFNYAGNTVVGKGVLTSPNE